MRMLTHQRIASPAEGERTDLLIDLGAAPRPVGRRDPHAVTALLAVLTVGLGSLLAIVGLWWAAG